MKATEEPVRVIDMLIPGACPEMPIGSEILPEDQRGSEYIATYGALPPNWAEPQLARWECSRERAVIIFQRPGITQNERDTARRWLHRYGMDNKGRPKVWDETTTTHLVDSEPSVGNASHKRTHQGT